jgi:hypothetical protein
MRPLPRGVRIIGGPTSSRAEDVMAAQPEAPIIFYLALCDGLAGRNKRRAAAMV